MRGKSILYKNVSSVCFPLALKLGGSETELFTSRLVTDASHGCITDA